MTSLCEGLVMNFLIHSLASPDDLTLGCIACRALLSQSSTLPANALLTRYTVHGHFLRRWRS